jgi:hypothetical protein
VASASVPFAAIRSSPVPEKLVDAALKSAMTFASGRTAPVGALSSSVATLTEGVLKAMFFSKLKVGALVALSAGAITIGAGVLVGQEPATKKGGGLSTTTERAEPPDADQTTVRAPEERERWAKMARRRLEMFRAQQEQYVKAARDRLEAQKAFYEEGRITIDRYLDASRQLMDAQQRLADINRRPADRTAAAQDHLGRVREIEQREESELKIGRATRADLTEAHLARMQAESFVAQEGEPFRLGLLPGHSIERIEVKGGDEESSSRRIADLERRLTDLERKFDQLSKAPATLKPAQPF